MPKYLILTLLITISFTSHGVTYTYEESTISVDAAVRTQTYNSPARNITRALVASPSATTVLYCAADETTLKTLTSPVNSNSDVPGTDFVIAGTAITASKCSTCTMRPISWNLVAPYAEVGSRQTMFCALGRYGMALESLPAAASVKILRVTAIVANNAPKPLTALQLPGALDLGNITPTQWVEKTIPVTITCSNCLPLYPTPGTMTWRLESSPDNPTAERPGVLFQGAESDAAEGTNVVTFMNTVTELSDYGLRWPRTNSAPLTPGDYRWTLTMTLSVQ